MKTMGKVGVMVFNDTYVMRSVFIGGGNRGKPDLPQVIYQIMLHRAHLTMSVI